MIKAKAKAPIRHRKKIKSKKSARKSIISNHLIRRGILIAAPLILISIGIYFIIVNGIIGKFGEWSNDKFISQSAKMGFVVEKVMVTGRQYTDSDTLRAIINIDNGDPIFLFNLTDAKNLIQKLAWVEEVTVSRELPDVINIHLVERKPIALWQYNKKLALIDNKGNILTDDNLEEFNNLPIVVGKNAKDHAEDLLKILLAEEEIAAKLDAAIRIEDRRWDFKLKNGIKVKLPEEGFSYALSRLAQLHEKKMILNKNIDSIDLRFSDRIIIKPSLNSDYNGEEIIKTNKKNI